MTAYQPIVIFTGEITRATVRGSAISATCVPGGTLFDRRLPRMRIQPGCNHTLFSVGCGLSREDWRFTAEVEEVEVAWPWRITLTDLARANAGDMPDFDAGWFAGGTLVLPTGALLRIVDSTEENVGRVIVTPRRSHPSIESGQTIDIWPGCDGRMETCQEKFSNWLNFGGHPFAPIGNPSLLKASSAISGGKK